MEEQPVQPDGGTPEQEAVQFTSVSDGWYCHECGHATTNQRMHRLLAHTWPFERWV